MPTRRRAPSPPRAVAFTRPEKIYFPGSGTTKAEVIRYYLEVAPVMLPHLRDRPITLIRFPDGVKGESFYEKNAPGHAPEWIQRFAVPRRHHEGVINYILINDVETLAWCANLGAIEYHPFLHRVPELDQPTHIAFDLDPGEGADLLTCIAVAELLREVFAGLGLQAWPKVSGSKGLQLYVPLNTPVSYAVTQPFAKAVAELLERQHPQLIVSNMAKVRRQGRVLIDWSQNSEAKTTVAVYSVRGKRDEPFISLPVSWEELAAARKRRRVEALFFTPAQALKRVQEHGDLFAPVLTRPQTLPAAFGQAVPASRARHGRGGTAVSGLDEYAAKRDFTRTAEPAPRPTRSRQGSRRRFVIQKHAASHLHYDFRLELGGTLKSWAVPKGLPYELGVKRSAFQTEDHPLEYLDFEGTIPAGQYGGGTVMVWDIGTYDLIDGHHGKGSLHVHLTGKKLRGEWHLYRIKEEDGKPVWLVEKRGEVARLTHEESVSVLSGRTLERIATDNDAQWQSDRPAAGARTTTRKKSTRPPSPPPRRRAKSAPAPAWIEPMVAQPVATLPEGPEWLYEVKWDGYRVLAVKHAGEVTLWSRREKSLTEAFPAVVAAVQSVDAETVLLDGEIVALDEEGRPSFQRLQQREADASSIVFYAFDVLHLNGVDLTAQPLTQRRAALEQLVPGSDVRLSAELPGTAETVMAAVAQLGLEGVIAKQRDSKYEPGERSAAWKKKRLALRQEFVIGGYNPRAGRGFESVLVGYYEGKKLLFAGKVRAGFNPRSRAQLAELIEPGRTERCPFVNLPQTHKGRWSEGITAADMEDLCWVKPQHVIEVGFVEWTRHGNLRHATYEGLRTDKLARAVVRET